MKESVTYQAILQEGLTEGRAEGKAEAVNQIALNMLNSAISMDLIIQFTGLSLEQIQQLQQQNRENISKSN